MEVLVFKRFAIVYVHDDGYSGNSVLSACGVASDPVLYISDLLYFTNG